MTSDVGDDHVRQLIREALDAWSHGFRHEYGGADELPNLVHADERTGRLLDGDGRPLNPSAFPPQAAPNRPGADGEPGRPGAPGQQGPRGADARSIPGRVGDAGDPGARGAPGAAGAAGASIVGPRGLQGEPGDQAPSRPPGGRPHNVLSQNHSDALAATLVRGDTLAVNSAAQLARLAKGTAGQVQRSNGTDVLIANPRNEDLTTAYNFRANATGAQVVATGVFTVVKYDNKTGVSYDPNSNFDATTNYTYTVPVTGKYQINCSALAVMTAAPINTALILSLFDNGAEIYRGQQFSVEVGALNTNWGCMIATQELLTAGHTIDVRFFHNSGINQVLGVAAATIFNVFSAHIFST